MPVALDVRLAVVWGAFAERQVSDTLTVLIAVYAPDSTRQSVTFLLKPPDGEWDHLVIVDLTRDGGAWVVVRRRIIEG